MPDVIASPSVRALARKNGIDLEKLARELGRQSIAREDLNGEMLCRRMRAMARIGM